MKSFASFVLFAAGAEALLPLVISGNKFYQLQEDYTAAAEEFKIYGVDYQPGGSSDFSITSSSDVLTNVTACERDAYLLNKLGANAIRVYAVSPWNNHDECMSIFNEAGIYVLLDVNTPDSSLHRSDIASSYTEEYLNNVFGTVDAFKDYENLMGFIAGNEIINDAASAADDPVYIRAVIRDIKQYINKWSNRTIPVGYAAADVLQYRTVTWQYLECMPADNTTEYEFSTADFFGLNSYSWCSGVNNFDTSGYDDIETIFENSSIPILFAEYGCNTNEPRTFDEVDQGIYGPLSDVVAGGFVYEYSNEANDYGLVDIDDNGNVQLRQDYVNLQSAFSNASKSQTLVSTSSFATGTATIKDLPTCNSDDATSSFGWNLTLPDCPATDLIESGGGNKNVGSLTQISGTVSGASFTIYDVSSSEITPDFKYASAYEVNVQTNVPTGTSTASSTSASSSKSTTTSKSSSTSSSASSTSASSSSSSSSTSKSKDGAPRMVALPWLTGVAAVILSLL